MDLTPLLYDSSSLYELDGLDIVASPHTPLYQPKDYYFYIKKKLTWFFCLLSLALKAYGMQ